MQTDISTKLKNKKIRKKLHRPMFKKIQKFNLLYNRQNTEKYSVLFSEISINRTSRPKLNNENVENRYNVTNR